MADSNHVIFWCGECNTPYRGLNNICAICNNVGDRLTTDLRPVFARERAILEYFKINCFENKSVWTNSRSRIYYIDGKKERLPTYAEYRDKSDEIRDFIIEKNDYLEELDKKIMDDYLDLFQSSKIYMNRIITDSHDFIVKNAMKYKKRLLMVSFSGGKDSTVVSHLVLRALGRDNILHVFSDTKIEDVNTYKYIAEFQYEYKNVPFHTAYSNQKFFDLIDHMGPPSRVMRWCCSVIKSGPITTFLQSLGDMKVLTYYGVRRAESTQRADYNAVSVSAKIGNQITASPIIDWIEFDIWAYIILEKVMFNKSYRLGYSRVGCWLCPMNSSWSDFLNSIHFKEDDDKWQSWLIDFAKKIGKPDPEVYVRDKKWAARQGGAGLNKVWKPISIRSCGDMNNAIDITIKKPIVYDEFIQFIKPLGKINWGKSSKQDGEFYLNSNGNSGYNMIFYCREGDTTVKIQALDEDKVEEIHRWAKYQLNKYQTCIQCTACAVACPYSAIQVEPLKNVYSISEDKCVNCNECVTHFGSTGCLVAKSLSSYGDDKKDNVKQELINATDGLPNTFIKLKQI